MRQTLRPASSARPGRNGGFTLIEVLIAVGLLSLMSIAIFQVTTRSFDTNFKLGQESTDYIAIVLSLQAVETDLAQIYTPVVEDPATPPDGQQPVREFWSAPIRVDGLRRARVQGKAERLTFINNGNRRLEEGATQSDFQKVTWEVERNSNGAYTLYRTTDWDAFQYDDSQARKPSRVALLENLTSAKFTYYRRENKTWEDSWDSEGSYVKKGFRFPDLISLKIQLPDPLNNAVQQEWQLIVKPNLPLNGPNIEKTGREGLE